jgi:hypothetical protein
MKRTVFTAPVTLAVALVVTGSGAVAAGAAASWSVVVSPSPTGADTSELTSVACSGIGACTAVGDFQTGGGVFALAERWNGSAFSVQATPSPASPPAFSVLRGVSCPAVDACLAVGGVTNTSSAGTTLAERWDGTAWSTLRTANQSGSHVTDNRLLGVSCAATSACAAVGSYQSGDQTFPLAERWNGNRWTLQSVPTPSGAFTSSLTAVSCPSTDTCIAVGTSNDGHGADLPLAAQWNGHAWSIQFVASPTSQGGKLAGVSCTSATACTAVGQFVDAAGAQTFGLAERWNGSAWSIQASSPPSGATNAFLSAISCPATTACVAVGHFFTSTNMQVTLAQGWDGSAWTVQSTPNPGSVADGLSGVACPATTSCVAVGTQYQAQGKLLALGERFGT